MKSDGQLYSARDCKGVTPPPTLLQENTECETPATPCKDSHFPISEELIIIGLLLLVGTDKCKSDLPLILALVYLLLLK